MKVLLLDDAALVRERLAATVAGVHGVAVTVGETGAADIRGAYSRAAPGGRSRGRAHTRRDGIVSDPQAQVRRRSSSGGDRAVQFLLLSLPGQVPRRRSGVPLRQGARTGSAGRGHRGTR